MDEMIDWIDGHIEYYEGLFKTKDSIYQHDVITLKQIKQLLQSKRTVTGEWVARWMIQTGAKYKLSFILMLKEKGIEVIE